MKDRKEELLSSLITGFIGLAYEGISSFLHHRRQKALQRAVNVMKDQVDIQHNKIFHLEDSMVMCGVYNSDTLEDLIKTVHKLHNTTTWNEETVFRPNKRLVLLVFDNKRHKSICNKFNIIFNYSKREICKDV